MDVFVMDDLQGIAPAQMSPHVHPKLSEVRAFWGQAVAKYWNHQGSLQGSLPAKKLHDILPAK
jgi:hypothetical protein